MASLLGKKEAYIKDILPLRPPN